MTRWCSAISAASSRSMGRSRSTSPVRSTPRPHGEDISALSAAKWILYVPPTAPQGRSIIALQSTDRERSRSRIVVKLADGVVTTPRAEADLMVTEHGIAELRGRTLAERVRALVAVANPAFRAELEEASERLV